MVEVEFGMDEMRVVELAEVPEPMAGGANESVVIADGRRVALVYDVVHGAMPDEEGFAVVLFARCSQFLGGGPNDEAYGNHPLFEYGLGPYAAHEVVGSWWIEERGRINHKDGTFEWEGNKLRHFVFAMKEDMFECLAHGVEVVGVFATRAEAVTAAIRAVGLGG